MADRESGLLLIHDLLGSPRSVKVCVCVCTYVHVYEFLPSVPITKLVPMSGRRYLSKTKKKKIKSDTIIHFPISRIEFDIIFNFKSMIIPNVLSLQLLLLFFILYMHFIPRFIDKIAYEALSSLFVVPTFDFRYLSNWFQPGMEEALVDPHVFKRSMWEGSW